jgi:holliday junction DNA helicase RuvA
MIGYLKGEILEYFEGKLVLGIGGHSGTSQGTIGYGVSVPQNRVEEARFGIGKTIELFIHTHVREEAFDLYGFLSRSERSLFLTLMSVSGIGPKSALGILSVVDPSDLIKAIIEADQNFLTKISGIGKKTAERMIVELRDVLKKKLDAGILESPSPRADGGAFLVLPETALVQDAKAALVGLGYREQDIDQLLGRVLKDSQVKPKRAEDLVRTALKQLA